MNLKPSVRTILSRIGALPIKAMSVCRTPLSSGLTSLLNYAQWATATTPTHDTLFHLYLVITLSDGSRWTLEKNEDINLVSFKTTTSGECLKIPLAKSTLSISQLIDQTVKTVGSDRVFIYDAFSTNCQRFVLDVLESNHIHVSQHLKDFIMQSVSHLVPHWIQRIQKGIVSGYNRFKVAYEGKGYRK